MIKYNISKSIFYTLMFQQSN